MKVSILEFSILRDKTLNILKLSDGEICLRSGNPNVTQIGLEFTGGVRCVHNSG